MQIDSMISIVTEGDASFSDLIFRNHSPYFASIDPISGQVSCHRYCCVQHYVSVAPIVSFEYDEDTRRNHYVPSWLYDTSSRTSLILFPSRATTNTVFLPISPTRKGWPRQVSSRIQNSRGYCFFAHEMQLFLDLGRFFLIEDLRSEVCRYIDINDSDLFERSLLRSQQIQGFSCSVDLDMITNTSRNGEGDMSSLRRCRIPPFNLVPGNTDRPMYKSHHDSERALYIHLLVNVTRKDGKHWVHDGVLPSLLESGFIVMTPVNNTNGNIQLCPVCYVYRNPTDGREINCTLLDSGGFALPPFRLCSSTTD